MCRNVPVFVGYACAMSNQCLVCPILAYPAFIFHSFEYKLVMVFQQSLRKLCKLKTIHFWIILVLAPVIKVAKHGTDGLICNLASILIKLLYGLEKNEKEYIDSKKLTRSKGTVAFLISNGTLLPYTWFQTSCRSEIMASSPMNQGCSPVIIRRMKFGMMSRVQALCSLAPLGRS